MGGATESRNGKILLSIIENTPYTDPPQSRIEELLIELKEIIEAGGGGGTTSYEGLMGKPKINGYTLLGDVSLSDIGAASEDDLSEKQDTISDLSTIRSGAASGATAVQPADLQNAVQGLQTGISDETAAREAADSEMQEAIATKAALADIYGVKPPIASGTDLNDMTAPGCYACGGATLAALLINCPTATDAFILYVDNVAATSRIIQRLYAFNTATGISSVYIRARYSAGWGVWYKFEGTPITASTQSTAALMSAMPRTTETEEGEKQDE